MCFQTYILQTADLHSVDSLGGNLLFASWLPSHLQKAIESGRSIGIDHISKVAMVWSSICPVRQ